MKLLLSIILLLSVINYACASFVFVQRFDGECGGANNVVQDGQYIEENYCDFDTKFSCSADGSTIFVTEYDHRGDCNGRVQNVWNFTANGCATDRHNVSMTASCVSTYDLPSNSLIRFDYAGQCNNTNWKTEVTNVFFNPVGICTNGRDPNNPLSFDVTCTATTITQNVFAGADCTGTPQKSDTFQIENKCGWFSNSMTICNN